jgi:hypothetical protein
MSLLLTEETGNCGPGSLGEYTNEVNPVEALDKRATIPQEAEQFWSDCVKLDPTLDTPEQKASAIEREISFYDKVYRAIEELVARNTDVNGDITRTVVAMFDVDETILSHIEENQLARPAFSLVVSALRERFGEKFQIGLLTTLPQENLTDKSQQPSYLNGLEHIAEPSFRISSRLNPRDELYETEDLINTGNVAETKNAIGEILDQFIGEFDQDVAGWGSIKLVILRNLVKSMRDTHAFLYIDDIPSAGVVARQSRDVMGLWVGPEVHDDIRRSAVVGQADTIAHRTSGHSTMSALAEMN